jgi:hypothetical protein
VSRPGHTGLSVTRYETCADATKRIVTVPMELEVLELADLALRAAACDGIECREVHGMWHQAGECRLLMEMERKGRDMIERGVVVPFVES